MGVTSMKKTAQALTALLLIGPAADAQLPEPNEAGISTGHVHLTVPDLAKHAEIWRLLGGEENALGSRPMFTFPGMHILLTEGQPSAPSIETTANHIGFSITDYDAYKAKLAEIGAEIFFESAENGQVLADLPDGVRIELLTEPDQEVPIAFHHVHLSAPQEGELRDWYLEVFSAEAGERRGLPSALVPGGRVDFIPARGEAPKPSRGGAIDHIGFEVADMDAFAAHLAELDIEFDRAPTRIDAIGLTIAFLTDPAGTYIEVTEGLDDIE
jgi:catechol 2,3-dioxygenase-like lactoylglutathione lyase family enzyme